VRLFLDAHVSARRIATALREHHDVRAADEERELDGWQDERLLALASEEGRIMVTFNVADFARITAEGDRGKLARRLPSDRRHRPRRVRPHPPRD
jgi:hypothetical protein